MTATGSTPTPVAVASANPSGDAPSQGPVRVHARVQAAFLGLLAALVLVVLAAPVTSPTNVATIWWAVAGFGLFVLGLQAWSFRRRRQLIRRLARPSPWVGKAPVKLDFDRPWKEKEGKR